VDRIPPMGPNRRAQDRERAAARAAAEAKRAEAERKAIAEAERIVAIWNARQAGGRCGSARRSAPPLQRGWRGCPSPARARAILGRSAHAGSSGFQASDLTGIVAT
jgi:hypothetical protein